MGGMYHRLNLSIYLFVHLSICPMCVSANSQLTGVYISARSAQGVRSSLYTETRSLGQQRWEAYTRSLFVWPRPTLIPYPRGR